MSDYSGAIAVLVFFILLTAGLVWGAFSLMAYQCENQWVGRNPSFSWGVGCMIDTTDGRVPSKNYRVLD